MNLITNEENITLTLKEITDLLGVRHNDSMSKVEKLQQEQGFGILRETRINPEGKGRPTTTFILNKKQSIAAAARLNNAALMKVVNRLEELEQQNQKKLSPTEILLMSAQRLVDLEREQEAQKQLLDHEHKRANRLENNIRRTITDVEYFTVIGFANLKGIKAGTYHSPSMGKKAKRLSSEQGYAMGSVVDPKYGNINTYHCDILSEVFGIDKEAA